MSKNQNKVSKEPKDTKQGGGRARHARTRNSKVSNDKEAKYTQDKKIDPYVRTTDKPVNDPRWYAAIPDLTAALGTGGFTRPTGRPYSHGFAGVSEPYGRVEGLIWVNSLMPHWGISAAYSPNTTVETGAGLDGINAAAFKMFQFVIHRNGRNPSYGQKDLLMSMMAIDALYMHIREAERVYRCVSKFDAQNLGAAALVSALGWDHNAVKSNLANFRYMIEYATSLVNKWYIPNFYNIVQYHNQLFQNVYLDSLSLKAQYIVDVPLGVWEYNDVQGTMNYVEETVNGPYTYGYRNPDNWFATFNALYAAIQGSQYMGIMQGDLINAFGTSLSAVLTLNLDMELMPIYDEEYLYKWHNSHEVGSVLGLAPTVHGYNSHMVYRDNDNADGRILGLIAGSTPSRPWARVDMMTGTPDPVTLSLATSGATIATNALVHSTADIPYDGILEGHTNSDCVLTGALPLMCVLNYSLVYVDPTTGAIVNKAYNSADPLLAAQVGSFNLHPPVFMGVVGSNFYTMVWETTNTTELDSSFVDRIATVTLLNMWATSGIPERVSAQ